MCDLWVKITSNRNFDAHSIRGGLQRGQCTGSNGRLKKNGISFENLRIGLFNLSAVGDKGTRLRTGTVHVLW